MKVLQNLFLFLGFLLVAVVGYWDIAAFNDSLKWDMLDCYYPWRTFVAECVRFRIFPFWNPYQDLGYPIYADLRSVVYPEPWLVGLFGGYNLKVFQGIFIFYIAMAGFGMRQLLRLFTNSEWVRVTIACAYMLSGFFVGHGQELAGIISATWLPFTLYYFLQLQAKAKLNHLWKLGVFLFLLLTGGYQAINIIYVYLLLALALAQLLKNWLNDRELLQRQITLNVALTIIVAIGVSGIAVAYLDGADHVGRLGGLTLKEVNVGHVHPAALASFIAPYAVSSLEPWPETDITMLNLYVGLLVLLFAMVGLFRKKPTSLKIISAFGLITLLASLGPYTPVREWLYEFVPGMNMFRMSSFFSYFAQLALFLLAGVGLQYVSDHREIGLKRLRKTWIFILIVTLAVALIGYTAWPTLSVDVLASLFNLSELEPEMKFGQRMLAHGCYQLLLLLGVFLFLRTRYAKTQLFAPIFLLIVLGEIFLAVNLNFSFTVGAGFNPHELYAKLDLQPKGFPIPDNGALIYEQNDLNPSVSPLYHNTNILTKTVSWDGFNSFKLRRFEDFKDNQPKAFSAALNNPLVHGSLPTTSVEISSFTPNQIQIDVNASAADSITLLQTYFPGWKAKVDGKPVPIELVNDVLQRVPVPAGSSTVVFEYSNSRAKTAVLLSLGSGLVLLVLALVCENPSASRTYGAMISVLVLATLAYGFTMNTETHNAFKLRHYESLIQRVEKLGLTNQDFVVFEVDDHRLMDSLIRSSAFGFQTYLTWRTAGPELEVLNELLASNIGSLVYAGWNIAPSKQMLALGLDEFQWQPDSITSDFIYTFEPTETEAPALETALDFEAPNEAWNFGTFGSVDSTDFVSGNVSWPICDGQLGSPPLRFTVGENLPVGRYRFLFKLHAKLNPKTAGRTTMYVAVDRGEEKLWQAWTSLNKVAKTSSDWFPAYVMDTMDEPLQNSDVVTVFLWGSAGGTTILLDDLAFKAYKLD